VLKFTTRLTPWRPNDAPFWLIASAQQTDTNERSERQSLLCNFVLPGLDPMDRIGSFLGSHLSDRVTNLHSSCIVKIRSYNKLDGRHRYAESAKPAFVTLMKRTIIINKLRTFKMRLNN
jgi:hypothetical protein